MSDQYLSTDPNAGLDEYLSTDPNAGQAPAVPRPTATIGPQSTRQRIFGTVNNLEGLPGILVGAAKHGMNRIAQGGDLLRAGYNALVPESMEMDRPYQQAGDIPAMNPWQQVGVRGVQGAELAGAAQAATKVPGVLARAAGISKARAGANMADAATAAKDVRVTGLDTLKDAGTRAQQLQAAGGRLPKAASRLLAKVNEGGDLGFQEAQDFASNLSRLSANEFNSLNPQMQRQIAEMTKALREAITQAADTVGKGDQYAKGVSEYARAARAAENWEKVKPHLMTTLRRLGYAGAAGAGYKLSQ